MSEKEVFIIVGSPRTGTSLLCSILSDAGANFGVSSESWDRTGGAFEHELLVDSYKYLKRIKTLKTYSDRLTRRMEKKLLVNLSKVFEQVDYAKFPPLSHMLPYYIKSLGYNVKIILIYRKFEDYVMSHLIKNAGRVKTYKDDYIDMYQTGLVLLNIHGGCAISYDEIVQNTETAWLHALALTTGLDEHKLTEAREKRNRNKLINPNVFKLHEPQCDSIYSELQKLKGKQIIQNKSKISKKQ